MAKDWLWMSAGDLGRAIGAGTIDPVALTETYLDAIEVIKDAALDERADLLQRHLIEIADDMERDIRVRAFAGMEPALVG